MKPILFNTEMVKAILEGRKTVTRRLVKQQPEGRLAFAPQEGCWPGYFSIEGTPKVIKPPYKPGDILYVREAYYKDAGRYMYRADYSDGEKFYAGGKEVSIKWHPSTHMPKAAARIFLRVTDVGAERLKCISEKDALNEGVADEWPMNPVYCPHCKGEGLVGTYNPVSLGYMDVQCPFCKKAVVRFSNLWDSTIKKSGFQFYRWNANPWVWVIRFERISKEEALKEGK